jgi:cytochrome c2
VGRTAVAVALLAGTAVAQDDAGFRLYQQHCRTCHVMEAGDNRLGPHLVGVVGRRAGAVEGFAYSPTMRNADLVWDEAALDAFLAAPASFMPGNRMLYGGMASAADRDALIRYMAARK